MTRPPKLPPNGVPLPGLLDIVSEALFAEFRQDLIVAGYGDLRPGHGCVFRFVRDEGIRLTELATRAGTTKQSVGEIVDDLTELGYVERVPDPADRRAKLIRLTDKGKTAQAVGQKLFAQIERRWAQRHGAGRMTELREILEELAAIESPDAVPELARPEPANA